MRDLKDVQYDPQVGDVVTQHLERGNKTRTVIDRKDRWLTYRDGEGNEKSCNLSTWDRWMSKGNSVDYVAVQP